MPQTNLITKSDIDAVFTLSVNIAEAEINKFITNAQRTNLKYWLGPDLYYTLVENKADGDKYQALLEGGSYTIGTYTRYFDGVKMLLVWAAVVLIAAEQYKTSTKSGRVEQRKKNSQPLDQDKIKDSVGYARGQIVEYHGQVMEYLSENSASFPEWEGITRLQTYIH